MRRFYQYQSFRLYLTPLKRLFRGLVFGLLACTIVLSLHFVRNRRAIDRTQGYSKVIELKGKKEKIVVKEVNGVKVFHIEGLHTKHINEIKQIFVPTTLPVEIKAAMAKRVEAIYDRRLAKLQKSCGRKKPYHWTDGMQLISAPDKDLTVCVVQKAASTSCTSLWHPQSPQSPDIDGGDVYRFWGLWLHTVDHRSKPNRRDRRWHRLVLKLREPRAIWNSFGHQLNMKHARKLPSTEKERLMNAERGVRVITVRHPFARLLSGWNDKLNKKHLSNSTRILSTLPGIEKYIQKSNADDDHIIAFKDFAQYIADSNLKGVDIHFRPIEQLCQPCRYPYRYVTKAETSQQNLWWVLDKVGGEMPSFNKRIASGSSEDNSMTSSDLWEKEKSVMTAFFKELPFETVVKLKKLYQNDFTRFGYAFDLNTMTAGEVTD